MAKKYILDVRRHGNSDRGTLREGKGFCMKGHQPLLRNSASSVAPLHLEFVYEYQPAASNLTIFWNENVSRLVHFSSAHAYMHRHVLFCFLLFLFFLFFVSTLFFRFHTFPFMNLYSLSRSATLWNHSRSTNSTKNTRHQSCCVFPCRKQFLVFPRPFNRPGINTIRFDYVTWRIIDRCENELERDGLYIYIYIEKRIFRKFFSNEENDGDWGNTWCGVSHYSPCNNTALCVGHDSGIENN